MNPNSKSLSIVIPVYNSAATLHDLIGKITATFDSLSNTYEIVAVDDGSRDESWNILVQLQQRYPLLKPVKLVRNFGQQSALLCGVRHATGEIIVTMDDDLQHPIEEVPRLLAKLSGGFDVVYGSPIVERQSTWRRLPSFLPKYIQARVLGVPHANDISSFRVFHTSLRTAFDHYDGASPMLDMLLSWGATKFDAVPVQHHPRHSGKSNYNVWKLYQAAWLMITEFTLVPLRIVMLLGLAGAICGVLMFVYTLIIYMTVGSIPGFPFLASAIALFSSAQLIALGTLGEYLARIHIRVSGKPSYVISKK